jgi:hypothetical protein
MLVFRVLNHLEPSSCRFACRRNQAFKSTQKKMEAGQPRKIDGGRSPHSSQQLDAFIWKCNVITPL